MSKRPEFGSMLSDLARERSPDPTLEERTVLELQRQRLLRRPGRPGLVVSDAWLVAAATIVVFGLLGAFGAGYWQGSRQTQSATVPMHEQDADQAVASLRLVGASYQTALADLTRRSVIATPEDRDTIREAARRSLYPAAEEIVRLAPNDPLATRILQALDRSETRTGSASPDPDDRQEIVWF